MASDRVHLTQSDPDVVHDDHRHAVEYVMNDIVNAGNEEKGRRGRDVLGTFVFIIDHVRVQQQLPNDESNVHAPIHNANVEDDLEGSSRFPNVSLISAPC